MGVGKLLAAPCRPMAMLSVSSEVCGGFARSKRLKTRIVSPVSVNRNGNGSLGPALLGLVLAYKSVAKPRGIRASDQSKRAVNFLNEDAEGLRSSSFATCGKSVEN